RAHDLTATTEEFLAAAWTSAAAGGATPIDLRAAAFATLAEARETALDADLGWWTLGPFSTDAAEDVPGTAAAPGLADGPTPRTIAARDTRSFRDVAAAVEHLAALRREGWRLVLTTEGPGSAQRMVEQLAAVDVPARREADLAGEVADGVVHVV